MNNFFKNLFLPVISITVISSCGGGGSGDNPTSPVSPLVPTINFSANPMSVELNNSSTLSWSSTNATSCSALWTSSKETSGSEDVTISIAGNNSFSITCSGSGGSQSASVDIEGYRNINGISVDGYISGAEVCIDENENWLCDSFENSTNTNNNGEFTIKYANGNLLSIGGIDLDTQVLLDSLLINHQLSGHTDFKVISPITSIASFLNDPTIVNSLLGIDSSIDIYSFDPVPNKLQSGINDFVYEKGNQLTVLALTLQNIVNNINNSSETSQDFFKSISEELEAEYNLTNEEVDIESGSFIEKVLENVISNKNLTVSENSKSNTIAALSNIFPVIKVYSDNEITKAVFNFSISTAQNEIFLITNGTADDSLINFYTNDIYNYIADDQNIDVNQIIINSSPQIINNIQGFQIDENEFIVGKVNAVDDDGDEIYFSLTGTDASLFDISSDGEISFKEAPDYEIPTDADADNNYDFKVSVTDNFSSFNSNYYISKSSDNNARVVVQNIDEDLIFFNLSATNGTENSNPIIDVAMQIDSLTLASEAQLLIEYPTIADPDSISWGDGFQQWLYSGVNTNNGINWTITEELPSYVLTGNYKVRELRILRGDLDDIKIIDSIIRDKGFETYVNIDNPNQDIIEPVLESISNFNISGNDGNTSTSINVNFNATVIEDNLSEARVFILYPGGGSQDFVGTKNSNNEIIFNINLDPRTGSGLYKIERMIISDLAGNQSTYNNSDLESANINNSWELSNIISDDNAPELLSLELEAFFDNNDMSRKNIKVTVTTDAQETLIERIYIRLTNEDGSTQIDEEFPSTQYVSSASEYTHTFALPFEYPRGIYTVDYIFIKDKAQNIKQYSLSEIQNNSWDYEVSFDSDNQFIGKVIDGYISGAEIFIDQNFNFNKDAGEYVSYTTSDGSFVIDVDDLTTYECLQNRPIIANVPVGAIDSTLGEVTQAYQMILPSVSDTGSNQIVISPFTSLISEAILRGKNEADLTEDLTLSEGCQSIGDDVATKISSEVSSLISEIENTYNVSYDQLVSDFIANGSSNTITEALAQKIAAFFPYYNQIKDEISQELTARHGKDVFPNVSLSKDSLSAILSQGEFTELPLEFFSVYKTNKNSQGFYNVDEISSTGASIKSDGTLERYLCTLSDSNDCGINGISLNAVGNASKYYLRQVNINNDNFTVDGVEGNINIRGSESRGIRNEDSTPEAYCESEETIQFVGPQDSKGLQMEYRYGFNRQLFNAKDCSILPNYGPTIGLRIEKQGRGNNFPNTAPTWAIQFSVNNLGASRLTNSKVYNIIDNDNLDPAALIKEVAQIPAALSEIDDMRKLLSYGESTLYYFSPNTSVNYDAGEIAEQYYYRASSVPRDDRYEKQECTPDDGCNRVGEEIYGQDARDAIFNVMSGSAYDYDNFIGSSAPKSNVLFEYEGADGIVILDNIISDKTRRYRIFPRLNTNTGWIDASLVGSQISKSSMDAFIDGAYTTDTRFYFQVNADAPFTSTENFNLKIFSNNQYSSSTAYLELDMELKVETLSTGAVQVTWLDNGKITFKVVDNETSIIKEVINERGDISRSIPKGDYTFEDFDFLKLLLDKVRDQFSSSELQLLKDFFTNDSEYSYKIDLGAYAVLDDYDQTSSIIAGTFGIALNPDNSVYSYYLPIIFGEGTSTDICFNTPWIAEEDISFKIQPIYRNKPGFMTEDEVNFASTNVTIDEGTQQKCVAFSSPIDDRPKEDQEFIEFEIINLINAKSGRNIPTRLTVQDD